MSFFLSPNEYLRKLTILILRFIDWSDCRFVRRSLVGTISLLLYHVHQDIPVSISTTVSSYHYEVSLLQYLVRLGISLVVRISLLRKD
jgi:hypothetical protein